LPQQCHSINSYSVK